MRKDRNERLEHTASAQRGLAFLALAASLSCQSRPAVGVSAPPAMPPAPRPLASASAQNAHEQHTAQAPSAPSYFALLTERAQALAQEVARTPQKAQLPTELREIRYDAYRSIRFRPDRSLWRGHAGQFEAQFFHPGYYFQDTVRLFELGPAGATALPFSTDLFSYDGVPEPGAGTPLDFTGFRLHAFINRPDYRDEVIVFQGASYFRVLGQQTAYGLSARGLAIDLGAARGEEFPRFSEFYLTEPGPGQQHAWVLALLESERATGAYAFRIEPGALSQDDSLTIVDVEAHVFLRDTTLQLGMAPLTSMFLFGEDAPNRFGDFRPEVHDSDGLSIWFEDGEWLFRPLRNPERTTVCSFRADRLRGFGLVQRDRDFASYQDLEARYQDRPTVWVEPVAGFGAGSVRLLEIATRLETDDNIALAFVPDQLDSHEVHLRYRLHVGKSSAKTPPGAIVRATRLARAERTARFLVDFAGSAGDAASASQQGPLELSLTVGDARVVEQHIEPHPLIAGHRISFELERPRPPKELELRALLRRGRHAASETWSYLWQAAP